MKLKDKIWSSVTIGDTIERNPYGKVTGSDFMTEKEYNNFLIKDYIKQENKYMESYSKVFNSEHGTAIKRDEDLVWVCSHCGYVHNSEDAPKCCPICGAARVYFGIQF